MVNWFMRRSAEAQSRAELAPAVQMALPALVPAPDLALERVVTRVVHRALLALEAGDEPSAREWVWALFHADLRATI